MGHGTSSAGRGFKRLDSPRFLMGGLLVLIVLVGGATNSAGGDGGPRRFEFHNLRMGTEFRLVIYGEEEGRVRRGALEAFERVEELEQIFSDFRTDSELSRAVPVARVRPKVVSPVLFHVLERSLDFSRLTGGAFDVTVGPLVRLWRRCREEGRLPESAELEQARARVGYRRILLNRRTRSLRLTAPGMELDLGGIAKGFAADEALRVLQERGLEASLVDAGGDLRLGDPPPGRTGWVVALADDLGGGGTLELAQCAVATSGDRFQFIEIDGVRYSHILDPATGRGLPYHGEVTVVAPDALTADALATGISVLDMAAGVDLAERLDGVEVRISRELGGRRRHARSSGFPP